MYNFIITILNIYVNERGIYQQHWKRYQPSSMQAFFYICEYLEITPKEFFDTDTVNPMMISELTEAAKRLSSDQLRNLISLAKGLKWRY